MTPRYSLWLTPPSPVYERFVRLIVTLSRRLGTPRFAPHLTLAGVVAGPEADVVARARALGERLAPVRVHLRDVGCGDSYFRSLFVHAERTAALLAAHRLAARTLGTDPDDDFMPHLSLVYGDLRRDEKERLIAEIGNRFDLEFTAAHVTLCLPAGAPAGWRTLGPFPLSAPGGTPGTPGREGHAGRRR